MGDHRLGVWQTRSADAELILSGRAGATTASKFVLDLTTPSCLLVTCRLTASLPSPYAAPDNVAQRHYAYIDPPEFELRSNPHIGKLVKLSAFHDRLGAMDRNARRVVYWIEEHRFSFKGRKAYGLLLPTGAEITSW